MRQRPSSPLEPERGGRSRLARALRSPVLQFLVLGALITVAIVAATGVLSQRAATEQAVAQARRETVLLAETLVEPNIPRRLHLGESGDALLDNFSGVRLRDVERVSIWSPSGRLDFSWFPNAEGGLEVDVPLTPRERRVLRRGGVVSEPADPDRPDNELLADLTGRDVTGQLRTYTRVVDRRGNPMLLEVYYDPGDIEESGEQIGSSFRWITLGGLGALMLLTLPLLQVLTRRLTRAGRERARALQSAIVSSDRERRRIARDLHDGVVQDLAGTAFALTAVARDPRVPADAQDALEGAGSAVRDSLRGLRSLLAEIHPPDLKAVGLEAALVDLTAPAASAGVAASVEVDRVDHASDRTAAVVWRVAQEAVRNVLRHAEAETLLVSVRGVDERVRLDVVDDGRGFDPAAARDGAHYGLRGLDGLVADHGGRLEVVSAPGGGTRVTVEVDAR